MISADRLAAFAPKAGWIALAVALLAVAFQIQATPALWGSEVRLSAADLLSPPLALALVVHAGRNSTTPPPWAVSGMWLWLVALSAALTASLVVGRSSMGHWFPWAVVNKYLGWYALVWYLVLGGWLVANFGAAPRETFVRAFLAFCWLASIYAIVGNALNVAGVTTPSPTMFIRAKGFLENPNAFGFLVTVAMALQAPYMAARRLFAPRVHIAGLTVALVAFALTGSRTVWFGMLFAVPVLIWLRSIDLRASALALAAALVLLALLMFVLPLAADAERTGAFIGGQITAPYRYSLGYAGIQSRIEGALLALDMWRQSPILGAGLGVFLWSKGLAGEVYPEGIHNTFLWLLTETGLLGAVLYASFFAICLAALGRGLARHGGERDLFRIGVFATMFAFVGVSLGMEAMYQRHLWFLAGCALAVPAPGARTA